MKEGRVCHTCQRQYYNLMNANCGHRICFHCVKSNRNTTKCSDCQSQQNNRPRTPVLSPARNVSNQHKERSTRVKESESKLGSETSPLHRGRRKSQQKSSIGWPQEEHQVNSLPFIKCKDHQEPLTMYCKSTRDLICSICVCNRAKLNHDVVPLKMAQDCLKKETKMHKEESKMFLGSIQNAQKTISHNTQIFERSYQSGLKTLQKIFSEMRSQIDSLQLKLKQQFVTFCDSKLKECDEIYQDLNYLNTILKQYREGSNIENGSFNDLVYMFTSFKVIKSTIKGLNLDYVPYLKEVSFVDINKYHYKDAIRDYVKLRLDLPLKFGQKRKPKSQSNKSISKSKYEEWDDSRKGLGVGSIHERDSVSRKHQMSLCCNVHGMEMGSQQKNLYKMLLKSKFKL